MNTYQFSFEKLEVWQLARQLAGNIYKKTQLFPAEEKYSLVSQLRRATVSICANLAEGTTRTSAKDQAKFTTIAFSSLMEVFSHLTIASDLGYITENELTEYREKIQPLSVKLTNLKASQVKKINKFGFFWFLLFTPEIVKPLIPLQ